MLVGDRPTLPCTYGTNTQKIEQNAPTSAAASALDPIKASVGLTTAPGFCADTLTNSTDWEADTGATFGDLSIVPAHLCQPFSLSSADVQGGSTMKRLGEANLFKFSKAVLNVALAKFTTGNFGKLCTVPAAVFGKSEVETAINAARSPRRCLLLRSDYFARLVPAEFIGGSTWTLPGFPGGVHELNFNNAGAKMCGAVCDPSALLVGCGLPVLPTQPIRLVAISENSGISPSQTKGNTHAEPLFGNQPDRQASF